MAKAGAVWACCAALLGGCAPFLAGGAPFLAGGAPCVAQTFGDISSARALRTLQPGAVDAPLAQWLMTLPEDDRIDAAMLDSAPVGGEVFYLTKPVVREATASTGKTENGIAVWYKLKGRTASGEVADPNALTAGHRTLPLGTRVRVVNHVNGESVVVRINDRGPQQRKFVIDLSQASAKAIGLTGTAPVTLSVLSSGADAERVASGKPSMLEGRSIAPHPTRAAVRKPQPAKPRLLHTSARR